MKKLVLMVILSVIGHVFLLPPQVDALSCAEPQPVLEEMKLSSFVFKGKAIEVKRGGLTVFHVDMAWKGIKNSTVEVYDNGWDPYTTGTDYLVFGSEVDGELRRHLCGRTGPWDKAREIAMKETKLEPVVMKQEAVESATVDAKTETLKSNNPLVWIIISAILALLTVLSVVWIKKRNR